MQQASKRILVVDSSSVIQILLRNYLGNAGHHVLTRSTPQEALTVLGGLRDPPDLIFLTIDQAKEAYHVVAYVKEHEAYQQTRLVAMVLEEEKAGIQRTLSGSPIHYLVKPVHVQEALVLVSASIARGASSEHPR